MFKKGRHKTETLCPVKVRVNKLSHFDSYLGMVSASSWFCLTAHDRILTDQDVSTLYLLTHADKSRGSKALIHIYSSVCVSVCVSACVCPHNRTETAETTITKFATGIVHRDSWLPMQY